MRSTTSTPAGCAGGRSSSPELDARPHRPAAGGPAGRRRTSTPAGARTRRPRRRVRDLAGDQRAGGGAFPADVVAVQADPDVEAADAQVVDAGVAQERQRDQRRLRRADRSHADGAAREVGECGRGGVGADDDHRGEVLVRVAHDRRADRASLRGGEPLGAQPRQWRVPRGVDPALGEVLDLPLVVRVQDVVEVQALPAQPLPEPVPDGDDLGVVGDPAHDQRHHAPPNSGSPSVARPMKSCSASVVGAITRAARASR
jgi:hypothetical protein